MFININKYQIKDEETRKMHFLHQSKTIQLKLSWKQASS